MGEEAWRKKREWRRGRGWVVSCGTAAGLLLVEGEGKRMRRKGDGEWNLLQTHYRFLLILAG